MSDSSRVIRKYALAPDDPVAEIRTCKLEMPKHAQLLDVQAVPSGFLDYEFLLWALVDPNTAESEERCFIVVETDHPFDSAACEHLKTLTFGEQLSDHHALHVFERLSVGAALAKSFGRLW
jgi:hypothetical protein